MQKIRLGVNVDHVATIRNARNGEFPSPLIAAKIAAESGAEVITFHLREDRRHIKDQDANEICRYFAAFGQMVNFEMAATDQMQQLAINLQPEYVCLVPEKREELTTEGGLDLEKNFDKLQNFVKPLIEHGIKISFFIEPSKKQIEFAKKLGAHAVEIHTGKYANLHAQNMHQQELSKIVEAAKFANEIGLKAHAGHGLNFDNVKQIAQIPEIIELNIGHFLIAESIFSGLDAAVKKMKKLMDSARV